MNDFELESKLKSVRVPERSHEYWEDFPSRIRVQLRPTFAVLPAQKSLLPRLAWAGVIAFVCIMMSFSLLAFDSILKNHMAMRRDLVQSSQSLRALLSADHGLRYLVAEQD